MDERRKHAYRWLLYQAMLSIRALQWGGGGWGRRLNPFARRDDARQARVAGVVADWLHNLAKYSAFDFAGFDEAWFWRDYQRLLDRCPGAWLEIYREGFERRATPDLRLGTQPGSRV